MAGIESLLVGRVLGGRYRIEEVIGRGGMGAVYRALDERLRRQVALKVITVATVGDAEARERLRARFFREARSAAALPHHPNVVPVYDYGSDEDLGIDYLVMELLRGSDLASQLATAGTPPLSTSLRILIEAARGLAIGHAQGLIHRDVKPGNIFLARGQAEDIQVRVVDFGIAKLADEEDTLAQLTQDGRVPHSPAYASPEQLRGLTSLTPAADVFGLGAVGFQLLTGERPFSEQDRNRMSLGMPIDPPSLRALNPAVPGSVEAVIRRALSFDPEARQHDARGFAEEMEAAFRSIADTPIDPYMGDDEMILVAGAEGDDRTILAPGDDGTMLAPGADDVTLVAPPPGPARPPAAALPPVVPPAELPAGTPRTQLPPRPPGQAERRGVGGKVAVAVAAVAFVAVGVWGWETVRDREDLAVAPVEPDSVEVPSDSARDAALQAESEAFTLSQAGVAAYTANPPRYGEALGLFRRAVELAPENWHYRRNYGMALSQVGDYESAIRELNVAIRLDPNHPYPYATLGSTHLARGDTASAIAAFQQFVVRERSQADRVRVEGIIRELEIAGRPQPPLLGEPVEGSRPGEAPLPGDRPTTPPAPPPLPEPSPADTQPSAAGSQ